jgi:hypothetical protein
VPPVVGSAHGVSSSPSACSFALTSLSCQRKSYPIQAIVERYMSCIEEIINIPVLKFRLEEAISKGYLNNILDEIIEQSKVEFNYEEVIELSEEAGDTNLK